MSPVASLTIGWWPKGDRSWTARRRFPNPTVPPRTGITVKPPSSGPRCICASSIDRRDPSTCPRDRAPTIPAIPHIRSVLDVIDVRSMNSSATIAPSTLVIQGQHLVSYRTPGKLVLHPFSSSPAHILQRHGANATNCIGQSFRIIVDPQATPHLFQTAPGRPLTSNHWNSMGESLGHDDTEILGVRRHQSDIRTFEQSFLFFR